MSSDGDRPVSLPDRARALLDTWFGPPGDPERERHRDIWFKSTAEFDASLSDAAARAAANRALARGFDRLVPEVWRRFFYMPYHHSENLADQHRSVALFGALPRDPDRRGALRRYGRPYVEVIERFGRFPHRNEILGRKSTQAEIALLAERGKSA